MHIMYYDSGFPLIDCMHACSNLNIKLFYISSGFVNKSYGGQYRQRGRRGPVWDHMLPRTPDNWNEEDDGSQYLNNTGEGDDTIFDCDDRIDEVTDYVGEEINDYDGEEINIYDGEENVDLDKTETGEVYLYKQASGDHHMF